MLAIKDKLAWHGRAAQPPRLQKTSDFHPILEREKQALHLPSTSRMRKGAWHTTTQVHQPPAKEGAILSLKAEMSIGAREVARRVASCEGGLLSALQFYMEEQQGLTP
jgi:hypothetical protein